MDGAIKQFWDDKEVTLLLLVWTSTTGCR